MNFRTTKLRWARKLVKAKMFVVLTDKESCIAIDGANPESFNDAITLAAQKSELEMFYESLGKLISDHETALKRLSGLTAYEKDTTGNTTTKTTGTSRPKRAGPVQARVRGGK